MQDLVRVINITYIICDRTRRVFCISKAGCLIENVRHKFLLVEITI